MASIFDLVSLRPQRRLGEIVAQAVVQERHTDEITLTDHPIEAGAQITDHAFKRPAEVILQYAWSEAQAASLLGSANLLAPVAVFGDLTDIYGKLLLLQSSRIPFEVITGKRQYSNMLLASVTMTTDAKTEHALFVTATCREVIIVSTQATVLPAKAKRKKPKSTTQVVKKGIKQLAACVPSPGGALDVTKWVGG